MNPATSAIRLKNERDIIDYVISNGEASRVTLAAALGLSTPTVANIVSDLIEKNLLFEARREKSVAGRRTALLQFNGDLHYVLTVEIAMGLVVSVCNLIGDRLVSETIPCELKITETCSAAQVMKNIASSLSDFLQRQPEELQQRIKMIGLCPHGMVNSESTVDSILLNWRNFNLAKALEARMQIPVFIEGITRVLALYEMRHTSSLEKNILYLNISAGIGMVQFFDRKMVMGKTGIAGEIGHMTLDIRGPRCYCGNRGCFEYYCGMEYVKQRAQELLSEENKSDPFYHMAVVQKRPVTLDLLLEAQQEGSLIVHELLKSVAEYLGAALATLYNAYDPDRIIIAMEHNSERNFLLESAKAEARSRVVNQFTRELNITEAHLKISELHRAISTFALKKYLDTLYG